MANEGNVALNRDAISNVSLLHNFPAERQNKYVHSTFLRFILS